MELNRKQIINALEFCTGINKLDACANCPAYLGCNDCVDFMREESLRLIKELTEENDRLQDLIKEVQEYNEAWVADNGRLRKENERLKSDVAKEFTCIFGQPHKVSQCPIGDEIKNVKRETVRKMHDKIKENAFNPNNKFDFIYDEIDSIAQDMLEENK